MSVLERLGVFQYYMTKEKFENNDGWKWEPMRMIFENQATKLETQSKASRRRTCVGIIRTYHLLVNQKRNIFQVKANDISSNGIRLMAGYSGNSF